VIAVALAAPACAGGGESGSTGRESESDPEPAAAAGAAEAAQAQRAAAPGGELAAAQPQRAGPAGSEPAASPAGDTTPPAEEPGDPGCAGGMALVEGNYCLTPEQRCVAWQKIPGAAVSRGQCLRFAEPVKCFDERRRPMRYCMDRYEWPNRRGEKPRTLTSWQDARALCASAGKRLCTGEEFNFACEGEDLRAYVYGNTRDATQCNFDRPYRPREHVFTPWDTCQEDPACKAAFDGIDQRLPAGSLETCRSRQGVHDLIGNANEWVMLPDKRTPHRSGIKGGWWGPIRARCRPTVTFHDEGDFGYEVGFRCCADAR